jgi:type I restriction enzyme S subunit
MSSEGESLVPSFEHRREDELPAGWTYIALGDAGAWGSGGTPSKSRTEFWEHGTVPWVSPKDMKISFIADAQDHITKHAVRSGAAGLVPPGTILFVVRGMILAHTFPVALTTQEVAFNQDMRSIFPHAAVHAPYLLRVLQREAMSILFAVKEATHGTLRLDSDTLRPWPIPVPPIREQQRIVVAVEALLEQVNRARERLDRAPLILKKFRQAVLAAACSGRLTEEWRGGHRLTDVDDLLAGLRRVREANVVARRRHEVPVDVEPLFDAPAEWRWTSLGALGEIVGGLTKGQKRRPGQRVRSVPYLRVANVQRGHLDLTEVKTIEATEDEIDELRLKPGDVLFTEGGDRDKLGRGWVWSGEVSECVHQNHIFRARPYLPTLRGRFISWFGNVFGKNYFDDGASQTVNLASINITKLSALPVPVPPPEEQDEILRRVESLFAVASTIERRIQAAKARSDKLPQAILSKAFSGELVPIEADLARAEGRMYETAETLLARVRSEKGNGLTRADGARARRARSRQRGSG